MEHAVQQVLQVRRSQDDRSTTDSRTKKGAKEGAPLDNSAKCWAGALLGRARWVDARMRVSGRGSVRTDDGDCGWARGGQWLQRLPSSLVMHGLVEGHTRAPV